MHPNGWMSDLKDKSFALQSPSSDSSSAVPSCHPGSIYEVDDTWGAEEEFEAGEQGEKALSIL